MCDVTADAEVELPSSLQSPALARDFVEEHACAAHAGRAAVAVQLLASELVTNAVLYGSPPITLELSCSAYALQLRVSEQARADAPAPASDGLGMLLVDKVAHEWGTTPTRTGKTVWCTVRTGFLPSQRATSWTGSGAAEAGHDRPRTRVASGAAGPQH